MEAKKEVTLLREGLTCMAHHDGFEPSSLFTGLAGGDCTHTDTEAGDTEESGHKGPGHMGQSRLATGHQSTRQSIAQTRNVVLRRKEVVSQSKRANGPRTAAEVSPLDCCSPQHTHDSTKTRPSDTLNGRLTHVYGCLNAYDSPGPSTRALAQAPDSAFEPPRGEGGVGGAASSPCLP